MACIIDQTKNSDKDICWGRGDSVARGFTRVDAAGVAINITGRTYILTVNTVKNPESGVGAELFAVVGVITDAAAGDVAFAPTAVQTDTTIGNHFYDIEETAAGLVETVMKGRCEIVQDISK